MITMAVRGNNAGIAAADARLFGLLVAWTSIWAAITDPLHRPLMKFATAPAAIAAGLLGWLLTGRFLTGIVVLIVVVPVFLAFVAVLLLSEGLLALRADRVWVLRAEHGRACARVKRGDAGRVWHLESVAGWPFGSGCGTQLVGRICRDADDDDDIDSIRLTADTAGLADWYARFGFVRQGRNWLGQPKMGRACPTPLYGPKERPR